MLANLFQLNNFIEEYCGAGDKLLFDWCEGMLSEFEQKLENYSERATSVIKNANVANNLPSQIEERDSQIIELVLEMRQFANEKYKVFIGLWTEFDDFYVVNAIILNFWMMIIGFQVYAIQDSTLKFSYVSLGFLLFFYSLIFFGINLFTGFDKVVLVLMQITMFFQFELDVTRFMRRTFASQNLFGIFIALIYLVMQFSDALQQECDYVTDSIVLMILCFVFVSRREAYSKSNKLFGRSKKQEDDVSEAEKKKKGLKYSEYLPYIAVIAAVKVAYFFDREKSLSFQMDPTLESYRVMVQSNSSVKHGADFLGLLTLFLIETFVLNPRF